MKVFVLKDTDDTIEAVLTNAVTANQPQYTVHYADSTASSFTEGSASGVLNSTTSVTIVSAPAASTQRVVKEISVYNADTAPAELTVRYDNNGTEYIIEKRTIAVGETWLLSRVGQEPITRVNNYIATSAPTVDDDIDLGYSVGSLWYDITNDNAYTCLDASDGAAIWTIITTSTIARFYHSANQSIATGGGGQAVVFDSVDYDLNGIHPGGSASSFSVPFDGYYAIAFCGAFEFNATGWRGLAIQKNGTSINDSITETNTVANGLWALSIYAEIDLVTTDTINIRAFQTSGGALNLVRLSDFTPILTIRRIR